MKMEIQFKPLVVNIFKLVLIYFLILNNNLTFAQRDILTLPTSYDLMDLMLKGSNSADVLSIGDTQNKIIESLGEPDVSEPYHYEMMDVFGTILYYKDSEIYLIDEKLYTYTINSHNILIGQGGKFFTVGDSITDVVNAFPGFSIRKNHTTMTDYISIPLTENGKPTECTVLLIHFSEGIVTKIYRYDC